MTPRVGGVLLAAGGSRRLGTAKALLDWQGLPLVRHAADVLIASRARPLVAVLGAEHAAIGQALGTATIETVLNRRWRDGQATSVAVGLDALLAADPRLDGVLFMPCDQPLLTTTTIDQIIDQVVPGNPQRIVVPVYGAERQRGAPVLFCAAHFDPLRRLVGDTGGRALLAERAGDVIECPIRDAGEAEDVDTAADWQRLRHLGPGSLDAPP